MDEKRKKQQALLADLADICRELNWVIGIPKDKMADGLICGHQQYVTLTCDAVYGKEGYEIINEETAKAKAEETLATSDNIDEFKMVELTEDEFKQFIETGELPEDIQLLGDPNKGITYH